MRRDTHRMSAWQVFVPALPHAPTDPLCHPPPQNTSSPHISDPGRYTATNGSNGCISCPLGWIQAADGAMGCQQCSAPLTTVRTGAVACTAPPIDAAVAAPTLLSLRPTASWSRHLNLTVDTSSGTVPADAHALLVQWSAADKDFNSASSVSDSSASTASALFPIPALAEGDVWTVELLASTPAPVWRYPLFLRATWVLGTAGSRTGLFATPNSGRIAADCGVDTQRGSGTTYLRTHPGDAWCSAALSLIDGAGASLPECRPCPEGGSCNHVGVQSSDAERSPQQTSEEGVLVWDIVNLQGWWRVPWAPRSDVPLFVRCPRAFACVGVQPDDLFNATSGWPSAAASSTPSRPPGALRAESAFNFTCGTNAVPTSPCAKGSSGPLCAVCETGYSRVSGGDCKPCLPASQRTVYVLLVFLLVFLASIWVWRVLSIIKGDVRYALRDVNRIVVICLSMSQINVTLPAVFPTLDWPDSVMNFLAWFDWAHVDLVKITGVTCEADVNFHAVFILTSLMPLCIVAVSCVSYIKGTRRIRERILHIRKAGRDSELRSHELTVTYVDIFHVVDADQSGKINAQEFVDLLKLVGYTNSSGELRPVTAALVIQELSGKAATELPLQKFVTAMEEGTLVGIADKLMGGISVRERRRSSGSKQLDIALDTATVGDAAIAGQDRAAAAFASPSRSDLTAGTSRLHRTRGKRKMSVLHDDALMLVAWNYHRKLVSSSFSWGTQLLMLVHTPLSRKVFQYMDCPVIGPADAAWSRAFVRADYSIPCSVGNEYVDSYLAWLPLVVLVFLGFTLLLPVAIGGFLIAHRNDLYSPTVLSRIGWLYDRMIRGSEFWEVFEMSRKLVLTGVVIFFPNDPVVRSALALLVCIVAQVCLSIFRPHRSKLVLVTEQFAYTTVMMNYLCAILLTAASVEEQTRDMLGVLLVGLQLAFILFGVTGVSLSLYLVRQRFLVSRAKHKLTAEEEVEEARKEEELEEVRGSRRTSSTNRRQSSTNARRSSAGRRRSSSSTKKDAADVMKKRRVSFENVMTRVHNSVESGNALDNEITHAEAHRVMQNHAQSARAKVKLIALMRQKSRRQLRSRVLKRRKSRAAGLGGARKPKTRHVSFGMSGMVGGLTRIVSEKIRKISGASQAAGQADQTDEAGQAAHKRHEQTLVRRRLRAAVHAYSVSSWLSNRGTLPSATAIAPTRAAVIQRPSVSRGRPGLPTSVLPSRQSQGSKGNSDGSDPNLVGEVAAAPPPAPNLPRGWQAYYDAEKGRYYYHSARHGMTTWSLYEVQFTTAAARTRRRSRKKHRRRSRGAAQPPSKPPGTESAGAEVAGEPEPTV